MARQQSPTSIMDERPLGPAARGALVMNATLTILLFYLTAVLFMAGLGVLAVVLLTVMVGAARFGVAALVGRLLQVPVRLIGILGRRLWLGSGPTYRLALKPNDAPGLFELARELSQRSAVAPPESISIEMHANAWVHLRGYRRGAGRTSLGIGFDLLAGLGVSEVEAVLAHELAHARLVQRGFSRWLKNGLARLSQVTTELSACAAAYRQAARRSDLAEATARVFDRLTSRAARLVATYSRQDEFAADRGAAQMCGAAAIRSALTRLDLLDDAVSALPWSERLARLQPGEAFTSWLVSELTAPDRSAQGSLHHAVDPYSTHPALRDRLVALPGDDAQLRDRRPGIALLADPDRVAGRLVAEIQRVVADQERKDTKQLARDTRKWCRPEGMGAAAFLGAIGLFVGILLGFIGATSGFPLDMMGTAAAALTVGLVLVFRPRHRDRRPLPVPTYGTLMNPRPPAETQEQLAAAEKAIVAEFRASGERERSRRARFAALVSASYAALRERDYLRAHGAARLALEIKPKSIEASLGYAIAAAGLGIAQQAQGRLGWIKRKVGFQTLGTKWGAAWAMSLLDDWGCEGLLQQLHDLQPNVAAFSLLLALAQVNRHKLQSAIRNAERGVELDPANRPSVLLLANLLLLAGRPTEAAKRLDALHDYARTDANTAFLMVRLRLMQRDTAGALQWADVMRGLDSDGGCLIGLGQVFGAARLAEPAAKFLSAAAETRFTPEANVGLSILASLRGDRSGARQHLLNALKFDGARFTKRQTPGDLFHEILGRLNGLAEQRLDCTAWIATLPAGSLELAGRSVLVCAPTESAARGHLATIVTAMQGRDMTGELSGVTWRRAPEAQQPHRPVPPGVHLVLG